jgi:GNAT superfamily N-acetyltransferase
MEDEGKLLADAFDRIADGSFPSLPPEAIASYLEPWQEDMLRSRIRQSNDLLRVAWHEETTTGIVSGTAPEGGVATIIWLLVDAPSRGSGLGIHLSSAACSDYCRAHGAHGIKLTAPTEDARQFYELCGMRVEGFHPAHWWQAGFWSLGMAL